jgi:hypothetical protein
MIHEKPFVKHLVTRSLYGEMLNWGGQAPSTEYEAVIAAILIVSLAPK